MRSRCCSVMVAFLARCVPLLAPLTTSMPAAAQLISPGKLSSAHADLEGVRGCTKCHELRKTGASNTKCLGCHDVLAARITAGGGYHAPLVQQPCADCHAEHFGREFDVIRLDSSTFDHTRTGYQLEPGHAGVACGACHRADRIAAADVQAWVRAHGGADATYLGLSTACAGCHAAEDPHRGQFGKRSCATCHDADAWNDPVRFDHARTSYPLTGQHRDVRCDGCHRAERADRPGFVRYRGVPAAGCNVCHADPHAGAMSAACSSCHETAGWKRVLRSTVEGRFDHSRTRFPLRGRHAQASCASCHAATSHAGGIAIRYVSGSRTATYPRPWFEGCQACHTDYHERAFSGSPGGSACSGCHDEWGWAPPSFDIDRHARTAYPLTGAHVTVACNACHGPDRSRVKATFRLGQPECEVCHREHSPHGERFGARPCVSCHETATFEVKSFDHALAAGEACLRCHQNDSPHGDQFGGAGCESCHDTQSYRIQRFDHTRARFTLDGAHARVSCARCHATEQAVGRSYVRYRPLRVECTACHGGVK